MSDDNVEAVRSVYEGWSEGDFTVGTDLLDPKILFVLGPEFPDAGTYLGTEALAQYMHGVLEPWTRFTIEAGEIREAGDSIFAAVCQRGVGTSSGAPAEFRYFQVWTFRGGKVIRLEGIRDRAEALEVAGLSE